MDSRHPTCNEPFFGAHCVHWTDGPRQKRIFLGRVHNPPRSWSPEAQCCSDATPRSTINHVNANILTLERCHIAGASLCQRRIRSRSHSTISSPY